MQLYHHVYVKKEDTDLGDPKAIIRALAFREHASFLANAWDWTWDEKVKYSSYRLSSQSWTRSRFGRLKLSVTESVWNYRVAVYCMSPFRSQRIRPCRGVHAARECSPRTNRALALTVARGGPLSLLYLSSLSSFLGTHVYHSML